MASNGLIVMTVFFLLLSSMMILANESMNKMGSGTVNTLGICGGTFNDYKTKNANSLNISNELPGSAGSPANPTTGFGFIDWIASASNWLGQKIQLFSDVVVGPHCWISNLSVNPDFQVFANILSFIWYSIGALLLAGWVFGR